MMDWVDQAVRAFDEWGFSFGRVVVQMLLVGLLVRAIKGRFPWPKWLPLVSLVLSLTLSAGAYVRSNLGPTWVVTFAVEGIAAGSLAAFGNDFLKLATVELLSRLPLVGRARAVAIATLLWGAPRGNGIVKAISWNSGRK